jgi:SiaC family regulatory phosphoprotein
MGNIYQSPSEDGPEINFNEEDKTFKITGNSYPENCEKIYEPILHFIDNYKIEEHKVLNFHFHFNLINSTSTVYVAQMVVKIAGLVKNGLTVSIKWYYDKFDEELLDLGEKLATISKLPIEFIAVDDED